MSAPLRLIATALGSEDQAIHLLAALDAAGYVCVPRDPTKDMMDAAWAYALDEDAEGVWKSMIESALQ